ncbi:MAG: two-component regulator propeller domain-containing protein [Bacteroidales bacterium]
MNPKESSQYSIFKLFWLTAILFLGLAGEALHGQQPISPEPTFKQFTIDNGLPSNEVYHVIQDSTGYIWFATAHGVSRFNGSEFQNFGLEDGLIETTIHEIYEDYQGRLWFISGSGKLVYFKNDSIYQFRHNHRLNEYISKSRGTVKKSFYVDSLDNVYLSLKGFGRLIISHEGILKQPINSKLKKRIIIENIENNKFIISNSRIPNKFDIFVVNPNHEFSYSPEHLNLKNPAYFHFFFLKETNGFQLMAGEGNLIRMKHNEVYEQKAIGSQVIWASYDKSNNLWAAPIEGGVYFYKNGDFLTKTSERLLKKAQVTSVLQDKEDGYWITSLKNGVFYCSNIHFRTYNKETGLPHNRISAIYKNKHALYIGNEEGDISIVKNNKINNLFLDIIKKDNGSIRYIGNNPELDEVWIGCNKHIHKYDGKSFESFYFNGPEYGSYPRQIIPANNGDYWIAGSWGISKFDGEEFTFNSREDETFSATVYSIFQDATNALWMGTANGIWKYENDIFYFLGEENSLFASHTSYIDSDLQGKMYFGTRGKGLIVKDGDTLKNITTDDGLASNYINKIVIDSMGLWVATTMGISLLKENENGYNIQNINTTSGLPTNHIVDLFISGKEVFVATSKGVTTFNKQNIKPNKVKPHTIISTVKTTERTIDNNKKHALDYSENYISIDYYGLAYKNMGDVNYRYKLNGLDTSWVYTEATNATFSGLPYGDYIFEVQTQNSDRKWGDSSDFHFSILPPFWKTYWFLGVLTLAFSTTLFIIYRIRVQSIRKRNDLINMMNVYKQQSLRQQMNPHFIFNTLNSIQLYILEKDHISSHKYLTKFAKLMRLILDNSQQTTIPLKDEFDALKLYLELESIRLAGKFEYSIEIESDDLLKARIPSLIIQPFVENSIWHGIMLKPTKEGWVKISVSKKDHFILCYIEDNGIGREAAQEIRKKKDKERQSLGFKITSQRVNLLNSIYKNKFNIEYADIKSPNGQVAGTRVLLKIPYNPGSN